MPESSEIARTLGGIQSTVTETARQVSSLFDKFDKINEEVIEHRGAMKMLALTAGEIKAAHDGLATKIKDEIEPVLEDYTAGKNKMLGAIFGTGLAGGGLGTGLLMWITKMMGMGGPTPLPPGHGS